MKLHGQDCHNAHCKSERCSDDGEHCTCTPIDVHDLCRMEHFFDDNEKPEPCWVCINLRQAYHEGLMDGMAKNSGSVWRPLPQPYQPYPWQPTIWSSTIGNGGNYTISGGGGGAITFTVKPDDEDPPDELRVSA